MVKNVEFPILRDAMSSDQRVFVSNANALRCDDESLTVQSEKDSCDINIMLASFGVGKVLPVAVKMPRTGDFSGILEFQDCLNFIREATEQFEQLPAKLRERFGNNPQLLMTFLADDANRDEAIKLGLVDAPPSPVVNETVEAINRLGESLKAPKAP